MLVVAAEEESEKAGMEGTSAVQPRPLHTSVIAASP